MLHRLYACTPNFGFRFCFTIKQTFAILSPAALPWREGGLYLLSPQPRAPSSSDIRQLGFAARWWAILRNERIPLGSGPVPWLSSVSQGRISPSSPWALPPLFFVCRRRPFPFPL